MNIMKGVLSIFASVFLLVVLSYLFVYARMRIQMPDTKAIGFALVRDWTIYSPLYWIFVIALIATMYWLFHRWVVPPRG